MKASLQLQPMYCSRDYNHSSRFNQQYEKPTPVIQMFLKVLADFQDPPTTYKLIQTWHRSKLCADQYLFILFNERSGQEAQSWYIKSVCEITPWINSFALIKGKDKLGNLQLCICLDPTNLNKAAVREPYRFKELEDIAHLIADSCVWQYAIARKVSGIMN